MSYRWTEEQYAKHLERTGVPGSRAPVNVSAPPFKLPSNEAARFALGRLPVGTMNKTEAAYDAHLKLLTTAGEIIWHKFEAIKLRLADSTFYTCDFAVLPASGFLELHEVKGFWQDDARVKIKVAASLYPFKFIAVTTPPRKYPSMWQREEFS